MALFVLGDTHLSFTVNKPMNIFGTGWENHAEKICRLWNQAVTQQDTVVLAGDISWAMTLEEAKADFLFLHQLPGRKIILKGNHDYWWTTAAKLTRFFETNGWNDFSILYNNAAVVENRAICGTRGWNIDLPGEQDQKIIRREVQRLALSLQAAPEDLEKIVFFHYPPVGALGSPFLPLLKKYRVRQCYFGHLHGEAARRMQPFEKDGIRFSLISADALHFQPYKITPDFAGEQTSCGPNHQNGQKEASFWRKLLSLFKSKC